MGLMHNKALWVTLMSGTARFTDAQSLLRNELDGLAIDFTSDDRFGSTGFYGDVAVKDRTTPANVYNSSPDQVASSLLTYTSPSVKMTMGPSGTLRYQAHNLCLQSENLTSATWTKSQTTVASSVTGVSGATLYKVEETAVTSTHNVFQSALAVVAGATYTLTFDVRSAERTHVFLRSDLLNTSGAFINYGFNIADGSETAGGSAFSITQLGPNEYRFTASWTALASFNGFLVLGLSNAAVVNNTDASYAGSAGSGAYFGRVHFYRTPSDSTYLTTTTAARYALPLQWTSAGVLEGMLVEEARTSLLLNSQDFTLWSVPGGITAVTANQIAAPDGTTTADLVTQSTGTSYVQLQAIAGTGTYTGTVYAKAGTLTWLRVSIFDSAHREGFFNLSTGALGTPDAGVTQSIEALPGGWYRCRVTYTTAAINPFLSFYFTNADTGAGTATGTGYLWGAQLEAGSFATSYIQTFASTVTRAADNISLAVSAIPHSATENTYFVEVTGDRNLGDTCVFFEIAATTRADSLLSFYTSTSKVSVVEYGAAFAIQASYNEIYVSSTAVSKMAISSKTNDFDASINGSTETNGSSGTHQATAFTTMKFGGITSGTTNNGNMILRKVMIVPRKYTAAQLRTLTT